MSDTKFANESDAGWWFVVKDKKNGPVSESRVKELFISGEIKPETLVWKKGFDEWVSLQSLPEYQSLGQQMPPPIPSVTKVPAAFAWRRFFAKFIDVSFAITLALLLCLVVSPDTYNSFVVLFVVFSGGIWFGLEAATGCKTIGREILGISVRSITNNASYFKRTILLLLVGMGLELPIVSFVTKAVAFYQYRKNGTTFWDKGEFVVEFRKASVARYLMAALLILGLGILHTLLGNLNGKNLDNQEEALTPPPIQVQRNENPVMRSLQVTRWEPTNSAEPIPDGIVKVPIFPGVMVANDESVLHGPGGEFKLYYRKFNLPYVFITKQKVRTLEGWMDQVHGLTNDTTALVLKRLPSMQIAIYDDPSKSYGSSYRETHFAFGSDRSFYLIGMGYQISKPINLTLACAQLNETLKAFGAPDIDSWPSLGIAETCQKSARYQ